MQESLAIAGRVVPALGEQTLVRQVLISGDSRSQSVFRRLGHACPDLHGNDTRLWMNPVEGLREPSRIKGRAISIVIREADRAFDQT